jgi:simple sugar transport system ATP-binding protein
MSGVRAPDSAGLRDIAVDALEVRAGEIVGVAGVSGNGQAELMEILTGQRARSAGHVYVARAAYDASRGQSHARGVRYLPEEPLRNACAPAMSVAENIGFRAFDRAPGGDRLFWLRPGALGRLARGLIGAFNVKTPSPAAPIAALSGGNVQRAALARELSGEVRLLVAANPCFGLDFSAVADIRDRIMAARNGGAAVLLISEDLDEILALSDRIVVMSEGRIVLETPAKGADMAAIGAAMAGQGAVGRGAAAHG